MTSNRSKDWEDEFEERFVFSATYKKDKNNKPIIERTLWDWETDNPLLDAEKVEDFIQSLLDQQRAELIEKVEVIKQRQIADSVDDGQLGTYDDGLDDVINLLKGENL